MGELGSGLECGRVSAADGEATQDYSRGISPLPGGRPGRPGLRSLLLLGSLLGGVLLIAADLSTLYEVDVLTVVKASVSGHSQHSYAIALVGLAALPLTLLAARRVRPAMFALGVLGLAALAIAAVAGDFHDIHSSGLIGQLYENASAAPKRGFYFETLGAVLLVGSGAGSVLLPHPRAGGTPDRGGRPGPGGAAEPEPPAEQDSWL